MSEDKNEHLPKYLFKFFSPTVHSLVNLQNQQLHLSCPRTFNDPFDSYVCIEDQTFVKLFLLDRLKKMNLVSREATRHTISKEEYWEIYGAWSNDKENHSHRRDFHVALFKICEGKDESLQDIIRALQAQARREFSERIGWLRNSSYRIACFSGFGDESELEKNTTMWSHYAANHQGFCVQYSTDFDQFKYRDILLCGLFPVMYTSRVPQISPRELMKIRVINDKLNFSPSILKASMKALITKSRFWSYEREWRLVLGAENLEVLSNDTLPFLKPLAIYMGCKIGEALRTALVTFAESNGIRVFQAIQCNERFELFFLPRTSAELRDEEFYTQLSRYNSLKDEEKRLGLIHKLYEELDE